MTTHARAVFRALDQFGVVRAQRTLVLDGPAAGCGEPPARGAPRARPDLRGLWLLVLLDASSPLVLLALAVGGGWRWLRARAKPGS